MELLKMLEGKGPDEKEMIIRTHADTLSDAVSYKLPLSEEEVKQANDRHAMIDIQLEDAIAEYKDIADTHKAKIKELKAMLSTNRKVVRHKAVDVKGIIATVIDEDSRTIYELSLTGRVISQRSMKKSETPQLSITRVEAGGALK